MRLLEKYFADLPLASLEKLQALPSLYKDWNNKINLISRKDIDFLMERHVLFSLAIAKVTRFCPNSRIIDVGTGGGFPGIPLAIVFPDASFFLIDAIGKKIQAVSNIARYLELTNVSCVHARSDNYQGQFDAILGRAVTAFPAFVQQTRHMLAKTKNAGPLPAYFYLAGGDITYPRSKGSNTREYRLADYYEEPYFETKKLIYHCP